VEIQVHLPEPLGDFIQGQLSAGRYASVSDYLGDLVPADREQQAVLEQLQDHAELASRLQESLNGGEGRRWSPAVLQDLRQQVLDRHH
jgi:putative addiction module CopG family antidote